MPAQDTAAFDALDDEEARRVLLAVCSSPAWAERVSGGRPYGTVEAVHLAAEAALAGLTEAEVDAALAGHPRIGDPTVTAAASRREQAGMASASEETLAALAEGNARYEERFGHVYLVCASGRGADELLAVLRTRLGNTAEEERARLRVELAAINRIRLGRLLGESGA
ncbi:MAG: 2-oxo-4-hydroxy-4-carboxy-5-ureidoimidazoline decarboxylase [Pseudonocardia sp.]|nr:2-oxo-4-hydroxy-4-carboxy-5-ureidoimidazoline decarboxylase [Pseudonocardia sp.]